MPHPTRLHSLAGAILVLAACTTSPLASGPSPDAADASTTDAPAADAPTADAPTADAPAVDVPTVDAAPDAAIDAALDAASDATPDADAPDVGSGVRGGPCAVASDCARDLAGGVCLVASGASQGRCVECVPGATCLDGVTVCGPRARRDNGCIADVDCAAGTGCAPATSTCARCLSRSDCPGVQRYCNRAADRCEDGCGSDADCAGMSVLGVPLEHCATTLARPSCVQCVTDAHCPAGASCCGGSCIDLRASPTNCGACGVRCPRYVNSEATCTAGSRATACLAGFADCDGNADTGCEVELGSAPLRCGACGRRCSFEHGAGRCDAGVSTLATCGDGYTPVAGACVLTNVCAVRNGGCGANATCTPGAPGARTCACHSGYVGDGQTCAPESTCTTACTAAQTCVNHVCIAAGHMRVTLVWDVPGDMDLHVVPAGEAEIYYDRRSSGGGVMERDDTTGTGPENIYWSAAPPAGTHLVGVVPYRIPAPETFAVTVNRPGIPAIRFTGSRAASSGNSPCSASSPHSVGMFAL